MGVLAVVNQKGGCGKTTTAINLAAFLARERRSTLVVDMDPQGHASLGLLRDPEPAAMTMYDVLAARVDGGRALLRDITRPVRAHLDLAPADVRLSALPELTVGLHGRENLLAGLLADVQHEYDHIIIDCPPNVGVLTFNALKAASEAIIPIDPGFFSLHGIGKMLETLEVLARETGHTVRPRALITLFPGRSQFVQEVADEIRRHLSGRHFNTVIRHSVKLAEAASHGVPITEYCVRCAGFEDYRALATEFLQGEAAAGQHVPLAAQRHRPGAPHVTPEGVVFALAAPSARRVQLVGDFNGWQLDANDMQPEGPVWTSVLKLDPGRYRYRYVVDGEWLDDPLNPNMEPTPFGGHNAVLELTGRHCE